MIDASRSPGPPACLSKARDGCWAEHEVRDRLHADFLAKCYLCESALPLGSMEVDHRVPKEDPVGEAHRYDWGNLFPACKSCNSRRPRRYPPGGLLFPDRAEVESRLDQRLEWLDKNYVPQFLAKDAGDIEAANTAKELSTLHLEPGGRKRVDKADDLRQAITSQYAFVSEVERAYRVRRDQFGADDLETRRTEDLLRRLLSRRSPFTMLLRGKFSEYAHLFD